MVWFFEHGNELFIFFLVPVIGIIFDLYVGYKKLFRVIGVSVFLLLPVLTGYEYIIPNAYPVLGLVVASTLYSFYSKKIEKKAPKIISAVITTILCICIFGFFAFMDSMSGSQEIVEKWRIKRYKVTYVKDQGFAGGPLMRYEISKYAWLPIFIKKLDNAVDGEKSSGCKIHFSELKMDFDKCSLLLENSK